MTVLSSKVAFEICFREYYKRPHENCIKEDCSRIPEGHGAQKPKDPRKLIFGK
jgi:hypothetical protein